MFKIIHWIFGVYLFLIFVRVLGSWFPRFAHHPIMRFVGLYVDPYLNFFRRRIPPLGGTLDLSPLLAYFVLKIGERFVLGFLGNFL